MNAIEYLLELDGESFIIDERHGWWVRFQVSRNKHRSLGVKYSLTLHDKNNARILGIDNSHEIEFGGKNKVKPKKQYDHKHVAGKLKPVPYQFSDPESLLKDFWGMVDNYLKGVE